MIKLKILNKKGEALVWLFIFLKGNVGLLTHTHTHEKQELNKYSNCG